MLKLGLIVVGLSVLAIVALSPVWADDVDHDYGTVYPKDPEDPYGEQEPVSVKPGDDTGQPLWEPGCITVEIRVELISEPGSAIKVTLKNSEPGIDDEVIWIEYGEDVVERNCTWNEAVIERDPISDPTANPRFGVKWSRN